MVDVPMKRGPVGQVRREGLGAEDYNNSNAKSIGARLRLTCRLYILDQPSTIRDSRLFHDPLRAP